MLVRVLINGKLECGKGKYREIGDGRLEEHKSLLR
jgi:hypothetical protein